MTPLLAFYRLRIKIYVQKLHGYSLSSATIISYRAHCVDTLACRTNVIVAKDLNERFQPGSLREATIKNPREFRSYRHKEKLTRGFFPVKICFRYYYFLAGFEANLHRIIELMKNTRKIMKMSVADWVNIGLKTGWLEHHLEKKALIMDLLRTIIGDQPDLSATPYQRPYFGGNIRDVRNKMNETTTSYQQWSGTFLEQMNLMNEVLERDIHTIDELGIDDPRIITIHDTLTGMHTSLGNVLDDIRGLKTSIDSGEIIDEMAAEHAELSGNAFTTNMQGTGVPGIQGK